MNFYNPINGNYEVWENKPDGYLTKDEFFALHPNKCFAIVGTNEYESVQWRGGYTPQNPNAIQMQGFPTSDKQIAQADGTWETPLREAKKDKISELKSQRNAEEKSPVTTDLGAFDFDDDSRSRIEGAMTVLDGTDTTDTTIQWTLADNTSVSVGYDDLKAVIVTAGVRCNMLHEKYRTLRDMVNACTTTEQVAEIGWGIINNE